VIKLTNLEIFDAKTVDEVLSQLRKQWKERKYVEHFDARTIDDAVFLLSQYMEEAKIIAGGVDLVSLMNNKVREPKVLVNIKTVPDMDYITEDAEGLKIGALAIIKDIETSAIIRDKYSILVEAAHSVGAPLIRNMATIGGNLCQDVRCWYYRRSPATGLTFYCYRKGGERCFAVDGENQYHAIIGGNQCHAVFPSDMAPALLALGARVKIASPTGDKTVPLEEFYTPLGNTLQPNEIIFEIQVPTPELGTKQRYLKFRERKAIDFAISSVAVVITTQAGVISQARIVLGGVAPTPYRALKAEETLKGEAITESIAEISAKAAVSVAAPLSQNAYKIPITESLVKRAIVELIS
jgi:xanthine dehydrogenase YagS FAD-binding subunit